MLSKKLLLFGITLFLSLSGILVAMSRMSRPEDERMPDSLALQPKTERESTSIRKSAVGAGQQPLEEAQLNYQRLQRDLAYLDVYLRNNDLNGFVKAADELERNWSQEGGEYYGRLMLNISSLIVNGFHDERIDRLSQKYAFAALDRADSFSLELETKLLPFIANDVALKATTGDVDSEWVKERSAKAKLWLHAWQRLEKEIDRNFDFNNTGSLNVCPPAETRLPCGVAPEGIKDTKLRAKYEAAIKANTERVREFNHQFVLRNISNIFPPRAEQFLVRVYSKPPYNLKELKAYLNEHLTDKDLRERIVNEVKKKMTE